MMRSSTGKTVVTESGANAESAVLRSREVVAEQ